MTPWCHCICNATGAFCSAADRHSPVSKGSRANWPEEPWGRTSRALVFCELPAPVRGRGRGMRSCPSKFKGLLVPNFPADDAAPISGRVSFTCGRQARQPSRTPISLKTPALAVNEALSRFIASNRLEWLDHVLFCSDSDREMFNQELSMPSPKANILVAFYSR